MSSSRKRPPIYGEGSVRQGTSSVVRRRTNQQEGDVFVNLLSDYGCRLSPEGPVLLSRDLQQSLEMRLTRDTSVVGPFLAGFRSHIDNGESLHRLDWNFVNLYAELINFFRTVSEDFVSLDVMIKSNRAMELRCPNSSSFKFVAQSLSHFTFFIYFFLFFLLEG